MTMLNGLNTGESQTLVSAAGGIYPLRTDKDGKITKKISLERQGLARD